MGTSHITHVDVLSTDAPQFGKPDNIDWAPSLRVDFRPVVLKENKTFVRTPKQPEVKAPIWLMDERWKKRVDDMCADPILKSAGSAGPSGSSCYQSEYGKQSGPKTCQPPKTPLAYGPGEGSRGLRCSRTTRWRTGTVGSDSKA